MGDVGTLTWGGCYKDSWKGLIVPEAFAHPAKVARGLAVRLFDHGFERGWWRKNDLVCDPFMGVCGFGIIAAYKGLRFVGVEIEPKFHSLSMDNVALHRRRWDAGGDVSPVCLLGDSRRFAELVAGAVGCVTSPPYADSIDHAPGNKAWVGVRRGNLAQQDYGTTPGQLGALPQGNADGVITSPPYADTGSHGNMRTGAVDCNSWTDGRPRKMGPSMNADGYGTTPGQLGALPAGDADSVITSPPYAESNVSALDPASASGGQGNAFRRTGKGPRARDAMRCENYGATPGNVGNLAAGDAGAVVTSPGYGGSEISDNRKTVNRTIAGLGRKDGKRRGSGIAATIGAYADKGNVSARSGETYWDAVRCIYGQCLLALKPGGVACVVVKPFVRRGRLVDLPGQTWRLLLSLGFTPVERVRCLLSEETREPSLFGGCEVRKKSRVSFFRRLAEKKGAPKIEWEEILCVRKPTHETVPGLQNNA